MTIKEALATHVELRTLQMVRTMAGKLSKQLLKASSAMPEEKQDSYIKVARLCGKCHKACNTILDKYYGKHAGELPSSIKIPRSLLRELGVEGVEDLSNEELINVTLRKR